MRQSLCFIDLSGLQWPPCPLRHTPVDSFQQHRQLGRCNAQFTVLGRRPDKPPLLEAFHEQAGPLRIPPDDLQKITPTSTEDKQMTRIRVLGQNLFRLCRQRSSRALLRNTLPGKG